MMTAARLLVLLVLVPTSAGWGLLSRFRVGAGAPALQGPHLETPRAGPGAVARGRGGLAMKVKWDPTVDYYALLGLNGPSATLNDIKRAYRRMALKTHPDVNKEPNAAENFKRVCEAYKVLSNADLRRQYDMMRGGSGGGYAGRSWGRTAGSASSGAGSAYGAGGSASAEYKRWYDEYASGASQRRTSFDEERAEELDDSFGKILSDFLNTVASKGGRGVVEDVVEFLEDQIEGFTQDSSDEFEELLRSENLSEIQEEIENVNLLTPKLREKLQRAKYDCTLAESELKTVSVAVGDIGAVEKRLEQVEKVAALKARVQELDGHMRRADRRLRRLMQRAEELRWGPGGTRPAYQKYTDGTKWGSASSRINTQEKPPAGGAAAGQRPNPSSSRPTMPPSAWNVEEELKRMKKEMGL